MWWQALLLGVVQGVTEFLPVSSSGHLVLAQSWLGFGHTDVSFTVFVHVMTTAAVVVFFWKDLRRLTLAQVKVLVVATIPVAIGGVLLAHWVEAIFSSTLLVGVALLVTAGCNFGADRLLKRAEGKRQDLSLTAGFKVGWWQALAIVPGISRSGATLFGSLQQGLERRAAFRFAFLLSIPAILGAAFVQGLQLWSQPFVFDLPVLAVGGAAAFVSGLASLWLLQKMVVSARLAWFGWYSLVLGVSVIGLTTWSMFM